MKVLHVFFGIVLFVALIAAGGFAVYAAMDGADWIAKVQWLGTQRLLALFAGVALLLLVLLYLLTGLRRDRGEPFLSFESEGGVVSIGISAVRDFLRRTADEFAAVLSLDPSIRTVGSGVEITMDVRVKSGTQIPELCKMLQDRARESVTANLGISDIKGVKVNVREIVSVSEPGAPRRAQAAE